MRMSSRSRMWIGIALVTLLTEEAWRFSARPTKIS